MLLEFIRIFAGRRPIWMRRRALCWDALWNRDGSCGVLRRRSKGNGVRGHVFVNKKESASRSH